jgi:prepilin-type processing-associated H-X9-DG protein
MHCDPNQRQRKDRRTRRRSAFTVLELLIAISIVGLLVGLLLPALMAAREASRRQHCTNTLRQIGVAVQMHHGNKQSLPTAWRSLTADSLIGYGWAVALLPYLDENALAKSLNTELPITAAENDSARLANLSIMKCPSDISPDMFELRMEVPISRTGQASAIAPAAYIDGPLLAELPIGNYVGVFGTRGADDTFPAPTGDGPIVNHRVRFADLERGLSKTIVIGERTTAMVPSTWLGVHFRGEDAACRLVGSAMSQPSCNFCDECEFASRHSGGANFVWADGHVSFIGKEIDSSEYQQLARRSAR